MEGDLSGGVVCGESEELAVGGEVADGEAPSKAFIDWIEEFGIVDAPDAAWCVPVELAEFLLALAVAVATEGFEVASEFGASDIGIDETEAWDADGGAEVEECVVDVGACERACELNGSPACVGLV